MTRKEKVGKNLLLIMTNKENVCIQIVLYHFIKGGLGPPNLMFFTFAKQGLSPRPCLILEIIWRYFLKKSEKYTKTGWSIIDLFLLRW